MTSTNLLIIGAGPYGLAMAAIAKHFNVEFTVIGKPFEFWHTHTPSGMILRSGSDWQIDPLEDHTIQRYLREHLRRGGAGIEPLSRDVFLRYLQWFTIEKRIDIIPAFVRDLQHKDGKFLATLDDGQVIASKLAVVAPGFAAFHFCPPDLTSMLPHGRFSHALEAIDFDDLEGRCCLIVGGRQSAFEWAALIAEKRAESVHVVYPHPTPQFTTSDWSWVKPCLDLTVSTPGWFRSLDAAQKEQLRRRFWIEGRLKLEPWLEDRILREEIFLHPESRIINCNRLENGRLQMELSGGTSVVADHVILATGYKMDLERVKFLKRSHLFGAIEAESGYPRLDERFQSSVPGLFFAGFPTTLAFGPFFGFLVGAPATAKVIGGYIVR